MDTSHRETSSDPLQKEAQALDGENLKLRDQNEELSSQILYLQNRLSQVSNSNDDLSVKLIRSEEEKLKVSKELLEEKIQLNGVTMKLEKEMFDLREKLLNQSRMTSDLEMEKDKILQELKSAEACMKVGEEELKDEVCSLINGHEIFSEAPDTEVRLSEDPSAELLILASALRRQLEEQHQQVYTTTLDLKEELKTVQALILSMTHDRPEDIEALRCEQKTMEITILGNQDEIRSMLEEIKSRSEEQKALVEKVVALCEEHKDEQRELHNRQENLIEQSHTLLYTVRTVKELEVENSNLHLQIKHLNEEYRTRLVCYLHKVTEFIDQREKNISGTMSMKKFVERVLQDIRSTYRIREEQLASAASLYKKKLRRVTKTHQELLVAHRALKDTFKSDRGQQHHGVDSQQRLTGEVDQDKVQEVAVLTVKRPEPTKPAQKCQEFFLDLERQLSSEETFETERPAHIKRATEVSEPQEINRPARSATCQIF